MGKYIFLDTNVFLHCRPAQQLELERFGEGCTLVVPRVILGELNKHKDSHSSKTIRNRARAACKNIDDWSASRCVSSTLAFEFDIRTSSPKLHGLDPSSCDDRFLSDILEHPAPLDDKILFSDDSNLRLTAKHFGIAVEEIDGRFRLPATLDPAEKEARQLRRELDRLKNALPRLEVGLVSDDPQVEVQANPVFPLCQGGSELTDEEIERQIEEVRRSLEDEYSSLPAGQASNLYAAMGVSSEEIQSYRRELDGYPYKYRRYLQALRTFSRRPTFRFTVGIANVGTAPARNVDVYMRFPDGFELYEEKDLPAGPKQPDLPRRPMSVTERILGGVSLASRGFDFQPPESDLPSSFSLKRTNSYEVSQSFPVIKHNERACVQELFLRFASVDAVKPFRCDYRITVDNLTEEINGSINFQFRPDEAGSG